MNQLAWIALFVVGGYLYFEWSQSKIEELQSNNQTLSTKAENLQKSLDSMEQQYHEQDILISKLRQSQDSQAQEIQRYLSIFARHDLNKLAKAKPGLIETRVNNGTREIFETLENETRNLSSNSSTPSGM